MRTWIVCTIIFLTIISINIAAQQSLPANTTIPVTLMSSLTSQAAEGQTLSARVMQSVVVGSNVAVPAGAKLVGHVVESRPASEGGPLVSFRFDRIVSRNGEVPAVFAVRAIASPLELHDAQIPKTGPDEGTSAYSWTTVQVGGDVAYGSGGPILSGAREVGRFGPDGATARLAAISRTECGAESQTDHVQSLWLFSSSACGVYGLGSLEIQQTGRTTPLGDIVLRASGEDLKLASGTGLLLQVVAQP